MNKFWHTAVVVDKILTEAKIEYAVIKCYSDSNYTDGNIDIVVDFDRFKAAELFKDIFKITLKDRVKSLVYERNKLMLTPKTRTDIINIHIHNAAGWHNHDFVSAKIILANKNSLLLDGSLVQVVNKKLEKRILIFHGLFEKFAFSDWDVSFLTQNDLDEHVAHEYNLGVELKLNSHELPMEVLSSIWRKYAVKSEKWSKWNTFLLKLLILRNRLK